MNSKRLAYLDSLSDDPDFQAATASSWTKVDLAPKQIIKHNNWVYFLSGSTLLKIDKSPGQMGTSVAPGTQVWVNKQMDLCFFFEPQELKERDVQDVLDWLDKNYASAPNGETFYRKDILGYDDYV